MKGAHTSKFDTVPRVDFHARLVTRLEDALEDAVETRAADIACALRVLLASAKRRHIETLPDVTKEVTAA